jgi:hypothetical protein
MERKYCQCEIPEGDNLICAKCSGYILNEHERKIRDIIQKLHNYYEEQRKKGNFLIGSPFGLNLKGTIKTETVGILGIGIESDIDAKFEVHDFLDKITETADVDLNDISGVTISMAPGDTAQITITTYNGDVISGPVSSVNITLNNTPATDFTITKFKRN